MAEKKKCVYSKVIDASLKFLTGKKVFDFIDGSIFNPEKVSIYINFNKEERKYLFDKRSNIKKEGVTEEEILELGNRTNKFLKGIIKAGYGNVNYDLLLDGFDVLHKTKTGKLYDEKKIIDALTNGVEQPLKIAVDFNKSNVYKVVGIKNDTIDGIANFLKVDPATLTKERKQELLQTRQALYVLSGLDSDTKGIRILKQIGSTPIYFLTQVVSGIFAGTSAYISSLTVNQLLPRMSYYKGGGEYFKIGNLKNLKKNHGFLVNQGEEYLGDSFFGKLKYKTEVFTKKVFPGLFNIPDALREEAVKNEVINYYFSTNKKYIHFHGDGKRIDEYFNNLKVNNPEQYVKEVEAVQKEMKHIYEKRIGINLREDPEIFDSNVSKTTHILFDFLAMRGGNIVRNFVRTVKEVETGMLNGRVLHEYQDMLKNVGKEAADDMIMDYYYKNESFFKLMNGLVNALHYTDYKRRYDENINKKEKSTMEYVEDFMSYTFIGNGLSSMPKFRIIKQALENVFNMIEDEGDFSGKAGTYGMKTMMGVLKEMGKRFVLPKLSIYLTSHFANGGGQEGAMKIIGDSFRAAAGGYLFYGADNITKKGIKQATNYDYHTELRMFGIENINLDEYIKANNEKTIKMLIRDFSGGYWNYMKYRMPFVSSRYIGAFNDREIPKKISKAYQTNKYLQGMQAGFLPEKEIPGLGLYIYNRMTELNKFDKKSKGIKQEWYNDLRAKFINYKGEIDISKQYQENMFVDAMKRSLGENNFNVLLDLFKKFDSTKEKQAVQFIGFLEGNNPGSGKEIMGMVLQEEFSALVKKYGLYKYKGKEFFEKTNFIKEDLGKKYGNLMYITDKNARANAELFVAGRTEPSLEKDIVIPEYLNGDVTLRLYHDEKSKRRDNALKQLMLIDMYSNIMISSGKINGDKLNNIMATIWNDNYYQSQDPKYMKMKLEFVVDQFNKIDGRPISEQEKNILKQSYLVFSNKTLNYLANNQEERKKVGKVYDDVLHFLYGSIKESIELQEQINKMKKQQKVLGEKPGQKHYGKYNYLYSGGTYSRTFNKNYLDTQRMATGVYNAFKSMQYDFKSLNNKYVRPTYQGRTYYEKDRDYLEWYGKGRDYYYSRYRNYGRKYSGYPKPPKPEKRLSSQKAGYAVPPRLREMPRIYKDTDWSTQGTVKQGRRRAAVKYDSSATRDSVIKGSIYSKPIKKVTGRSSSTVTKGGYNSRSKNKTKYNKRNK